MAFETGNEIADAVLTFWFGEALHDATEASRQHELWFRKSANTDASIRDAFVKLLTKLADGLAYDWAEQGPQVRLAAIIVLDQFSRNIYRDDPRSFAQDKIALGLTKDGILKDEDKPLSPMERVFFYLPLEHSERKADQALSVDLYTSLAAQADEAFKPILTSTLDYAQRHKDVIEKYGRFPHRNAVLGRTSTPEELDYLAQPGAGF